MSARREIVRLLKTCADARLPRFLAQGHADGGQNGPYGYPETPARNTAHWLITLCFLWRETGEEQYRQAAAAFEEYLMERQKETACGAVQCILRGGADHTDGLIGLSWVIEGLMYAHRTLGDQRALDCAEKIFLSQRFDPKTGLWKRVDVDGTEMGYDFTLNHQVWFCASGLMILSERENPALRAQTDRFLDRLTKEYFGVRKSGLIRHYGAMRRPRRELMGLYARQWIKDWGLKAGVFSPEKFDIVRQEEGYHLFELYGFALLKQYRPDLPLFARKKFRRALAYGQDAETLNRRLLPRDGLPNRYAYPYNSPAYEYPFALQSLSGGAEEETVRALLGIQQDMCWDENALGMCRNTPDGETLTARLYELVRYCEMTAG